MNRVQQLEAENAKLRQQIQEHHENGLKEEFWNRVGKNVTYLMSQRQKSEWSQICKSAFDHELQRTPTTGNLILMDLEQRNKE